MAHSHREKVTPPPSPSPLKRMKSPFIPNSTHPASRPSSQPPQSRLSLRTRTKFRLLILTLITLAFIFILNEVRCLGHGCVGVRHIGEGGKVERIGGGSVLPVGWRGGSGDDKKENVVVQKIMDGGVKGAKKGAGVGVEIGNGDDLGVEGSGGKNNLGDIIRSGKTAAGMVPQLEGEWMGGQGKAAYDDGPASTPSPSPSPSPSALAAGKPAPSPSSPKKNSTSHQNTKPNLSIPKPKVQPNLRPPTHLQSLSKSPLDHAVYTGLQDSGTKDEDDMVKSEDGYENEGDEEDEHKTPPSKPAKPLKHSAIDMNHLSSSSSNSRLATDPESERDMETEGERKSEGLALSVTSPVPALAHTREKSAKQLGSMDMGVFGGM